MLLISFLITVLVTAASLLIISRLPLGIEVDSINKALIAGLVFGLLNALVKPVLTFFSFPLILLTLGLFYLVLNVLIFALTAQLVEGFRLRWGIWSAVLGAFILSILNSILGQILSQILPAATTGS